MSLRLGRLSYNQPAGSPVSGGTPPSSSNFGGFVRYYDNQYTQESPLMCPADQTVILPNNGLLNTTKQYLSSDLQLFNFVQNNRFYPYSVGDTYILRLSFNASSTVINNSITLQLFVSSILQQDSKSFDTSAGQSTRLTFNYTVFCLDNFKASGGVFRIQSEFDAQIWDIGLLILPMSRG